MTLSSSKSDCGDGWKKDQTPSIVPNATDAPVTGTDFADRVLEAQGRAECVDSLGRDVSPKVQKQQL